MYFHRKISKYGRCLQLLEAYRPPGGGHPRHRVLASLGDCALADECFAPLASLIASRLHGKPLLLPPALPPDALALADRLVAELRTRQAAEQAAVATAPPASAGQTLDGVLLDLVAHQHATPLGPLLVGLQAWLSLGLDDLLGNLGLSAAQRQAACALVLGRLDDPQSEHGFYQRLPHSSLPDLLGPSVSQGGVQRYYRIGDKLLQHRDALETHLRERLGQHFGLQRTIFLYDLTNFHFEGVCASNPQARRGHNKQMRHDCPQVVVGMVFDEHGFEVLHRTFAGNTSDCKTLPQMAQALHRAAGEQQLALAATPTVVMDGGLATADNLAELRRLGYHYLVNDKRTRRQVWLSRFQSPGFTPLPGRRLDEEILIKRFELAPGEDGAVAPEQLLLCQSPGRKAKELAMRSQAESRYLKALTALAGRFGKGRYRQRDRCQETVARIQAQHPRVRRFYQVSLSADAPPKLTWTRREEAWREADDLAGGYALRTDRHDLDGPTIWQLYMTLCRAEDGFRTVKSELGLRPAFHHLEARVKAHVFITVLAYQVLRFVLHTLEQNGDRRSWPTLRQVLQTHAYATINLPVRGGAVHQVRRPGIPEACQWEIYHQLGLRSLSHLPRNRTLLPPPPAP